MRLPYWSASWPEAREATNDRPGPVKPTTSRYRLWSRARGSVALDVRRRSRLRPDHHSCPRLAVGEDRAAARARPGTRALRAGARPQAGRAPEGGAVQDLLLPAGLERVRRKLRAAPGGDRQMVAILSAVLTDGPGAVEVACAEALAAGVHSADVVLNILPQRREPGPPLTITTPDALRLCCEPAADCTRYDRLRKAI
jgi:hypothetical protein